MRKTVKEELNVRRKRDFQSPVVDFTENLLLGVPCSRIAEKITETKIFCPNEETALAVAAGALISGGKPTVYMQNSGFGRCIDVLTSLYLPYEIPYPKIIMSVRNSPKHHLFIGQITEDLLELLGLMDIELVVQKEPKHA